MNFSFTAIALWLAGFVGHSALLAVLVIRRRVRVVPWFTAWMVFNLAYTLALFTAYHLRAKHTYALLYWSGGFIDLLLQVSIVLEIAGYVFRRGGIWVTGAKGRLVVAGTASALGGMALSWLMTPATSTRLEGLQARADLGSTVLIELFFTAVMVTSHQLGLSWRSLVLWGRLRSGCLVRVFFRYRHPPRVLAYRALLQSAAARPDGGVLKRALLLGRSLLARRETPCSTHGRATKRYRKFAQKVRIAPS